MCSATAPSIGVLTNVTLVLPNVTAAEYVVSGNPNDLFQLGLLRQDLNSNGIFLGTVGGGMYVVVGSLTVTAPGGDATSSLTPLAPNVYLTSPPPPSPPGTAGTAASVKASSADRAAVAISALLLAAVAAMV